MPPSRQERRKAERAAAKRAPVEAGVARAAGAAGAAGAAAALGNLHVNPVDDWTTQAEDPAAVKRKVGEGDREARFSYGCRLLSEVNTVRQDAGRSPRAEAGLSLAPPGPGPSPDRGASTVT